MSKYFNLFNSFVVMLCLGSVYAWSVFVPELKDNYGFSAAQTQIVFGALIAVFTLTMVLAGKWQHEFGSNVITFLSALFFGLGYFIAGTSNGNFFIVFFGIGILGGIGTGFGYLASITNPVRWFPDKKGLVTGIAAAGFGLGAVTLTWIAGSLIEKGSSIMEIFRIVGVSYGLIIFLLSFKIEEPAWTSLSLPAMKKGFFKEKNFIRLTVGIFCGTFAGLFVIGNLKPIGEQFHIKNDTLLLGITLFSVANFTGRLAWGLLSDYLSGKIVIPLALGLSGVFVFLIGSVQLTSVSYLIFSTALGFSFGANFVLFARESAHLYGVDNMGIIYPYVFLGSGVAGILGPTAGGYIADHFNNYSCGLILASLVALTGAAMFSPKVSQILKTNSK